MHNKILIVMALESESQGRLEAAGYHVLYTGVGKLNAAINLTKALAEARAQYAPISLVLNLGTAGSGRFSQGSLVAASRFIQRDMDATGIGFQPGETPFDTMPVILEFPRIFTDIPHGLCGSGDSFAQAVCPLGSEIVDMEAYAHAHVCYREAIPFACVKYITDGADGTAHVDWQTNLMRAGDAFCALLVKQPIQNTYKVA